jgi:hypothetical protein
MDTRGATLKSTIHSHIRSLSLDGCLGVSLTMRQFADGVRLDDIRSSQNLRHFLNRVNGEVFGKAFKRFGKRLNVIPALEKSPTDRLHYHLILQSPYPDDPQKAKALIERAWTETRFGYQQTHVHPGIDHGWTDYITKFKSASDGIDWENYHWN